MPTRGLPIAAGFVERAELEMRRGHPLIERYRALEGGTRARGIARGTLDKAVHEVPVERGRLQFEAGAHPFPRAGRVPRRRFDARGIEMNRSKTRVQADGQIVLLERPATLSTRSQRATEFMPPIA